LLAQRSRWEQFTDAIAGILKPARDESA